SPRGTRQIMTTTALTVDAKDVVKRFKGAVGGPALNGITLSIPKGQLTALVGPDGAGKTTLIRLIAGLMKPDSGSLYTLGIDVAAKAPGGTRPHQLHASTLWPL
ncbi:ATP-binding cassette domain-containing protein, partial [Pseudomonas aeruginosa]|uniref:ATP-binding cassette domain-containing protein n=1 Tax=Pseudomonas aeruginosa TaxID=287 RepID=UPI003D780792